MIRHPGYAEPQRRPAPVRARRQALRRHRGRRRRRRSARERAGQGRAARQAAAHQPPQARLAALPVAAGQPLRRRAGQERDLRARPAQPVPLLLRPRPDPDRRRRARTAGRRSTTRRAESLRGANFGWDHFEGDHRFDYPGDNEARRAGAATRGRSSSTGTRRNCASFEGGCSIIGGYVVRQPQAAQPPRALPVRGLLRRQAAQLRPAPPPRQARPGARRPRRPSELVRKGSRRGRSTSPPSTARCTSSCASSAPPSGPAPPIAQCGE